MAKVSGTKRRAGAHRRVAVVLATIAVLTVGGGGSAVGAREPKSGGLGEAVPATPKVACDVAAIRAAVTDPNVSFANDGKTTTGQITVQSAQTLTTPAPGNTPYCRVDGTVVTTGDDVNDVKFQASMPTQNFNGRYFQAGQGGAGGSVTPPRNVMLDQGYVSATTDRGAVASTGLNFGTKTGLCEDGCAFHVAAVAAQRLTQAFYATNTLRRYVSGCSAGGADGRTNTLFYGTEDFDGVVSGDNPQGFGLVIGFARVAKYVSEHPDSWISADQLTKTEAAVLAKYDNVDGATDGIIQDDRNFRLDDQVLIDSGLTPAEITAIRFINSPWEADSKLVSPDGHFAGYPIGRLSQWNLLFGIVPPPWTTGQATGAAGFTVANSFLTSIDPTYDFNKLTFDQIVDIYDKNRAPRDTDPRDFRKSGGKAILYNGKGDGFVTYFDNLADFERLGDLKGKPSRDQWMRMYLVPGMDHCSGPNGPADAEQQFISAVADWVESGKAPDSVNASRPASDTKPARTFLMCSEPNAARFVGKGDVNNAASWKCVSTTTGTPCSKKNWLPLEPCPKQSANQGVSFQLD